MKKLTIKKINSTLTYSERLPLSRPDGTGNNVEILPARRYFYLIQSLKEFIDGGCTPSVEGNIVILRQGRFTSRIDTSNYPAIVSNEIIDLVTPYLS